ncbi:701_t:CDS:2 [Acaulospora colombiana]|uniref:701_t:CDS:1 n=1 Tax=Acaulospora colombiana TaxID=27376 RepID=A0ACA9L446_9GLOM|nr:701_t:CDS:2 [Acaulospora colombiana]
MVCSLPFQIGKNVSVKDYNTFLDHNESTGYKFYWENKNVYIIDIANPEHEAVVTLLQDIFKVPNGGIIFDPPIDVTGQPFHWNPSDNATKIASDITIYPDVAHVPNPTIQHPGPPPSDVKAKLWTRQIPAPPGSTSSTNPALTGISVQEWDFGTLQFNSNQPTGCTTANNPAYQVNIPVSDVFWDPPIVAGVPNVTGYTIAVPPTVTANNFVIDLYRIQQVVLKKQRSVIC